MFITYFAFYGTQLPIILLSPDSKEKKRKMKEVAKKTLAEKAVRGDAEEVMPLKKMKVEPAPASIATFELVSV